MTEMPETYFPPLVISAKDGDNELSFAITESFQRDHVELGHYITKNIEILRSALWKQRPGK